jgi:Tryptophan-associated transmembrane protein (Trp_oprn_chp)
MLRSRMGGFLVASVGALVMGVGATTTWITVGIPNEPAHTAIRGVDLTDGVIVLLCAVAVLAGVFATRIAGSSSGRQVLAALVAIAGLIAVSIGSAFLIGGRDRDAVVKALGVPRELWPQFGAFRTFGPGAILVVIGGLLGILGGVLTLAGSRREAEAQDAEII